MKRRFPQTVIAASALLLLLPALLPAQSGREFRRSNVVAGNRVKTVFGNWGVIGQPSTGGPRGAWIYDNDGYIGDVSPFVGAEVTSNGKTFHSVVTCAVDRPTRRRDESPTGKSWTWEPVEGYLNANQGAVAILSDPKTWPLFWPDKLNDTKDPGWKGSWNGYFGKTSSGDEETYFVMDDNNDEKFNYANYNQYQAAFKPDANNPARNGLGLEMRVRALQWAQFLAQDNIFWLYEISNKGTTDYTKAVFGMLAGTYVGVTGNDDTPHEYDDDFSFFDVSKDLTYTGDYPDNNSRNPSWIGPVGLVGYAFLESPGNPFDGIDNDDDADRNGVPTSAPRFTQSSFDSTLINAGDKLVLIDDNFVRTVVTCPSTTTTLHTRGADITIVPGVTKLAEGNVIKDAQGNDIVNPNAYDGVDNDLDGLIDENYYVHFRQLKKDPAGNVLIDQFRPVRYKNYITGQGVNDAMIDERRDDLIDNDRDWSIDIDDVGRDGVPNTYDYGEGDGAPTSGYDQSHHDTGLPGEPNIDKTDVDESDQIGLTSFQYFTPAGDISMYDDEDLWKRLSPGFFDVPRSIVNNRPTRGEDGDFIYGSGYFPLRAGFTERFSLALVYGGGAGGFESDLADLEKHRATVQKIYNSNYRFPVAPDKPTLTVVPGDKQVTLYWDRKSEKSFDPVLRVYDFEGYKIYRATDPNFNDVNTITDADGNVVAYKALAQYDLKDSVQGYFRASPDLFETVSGRSFFLGSNTGIVHSYVDHDVENGRRYYYALTSYDRGNELTDIFPSENSKRIKIQPDGTVQLDINTGMAVPNAPSAGYTPPSSDRILKAVTSFATGIVSDTIIDARKITGHTYEVTFTDISTDGIDNDGNGLADPVDPKEIRPITATYSVKDLTQLTFSTTVKDTLPVRLPHQNIEPSSFVLKDASGPVDTSRYLLNAARGEIKQRAPGSLSGDYTILYKYFPVYQSPYITGSPWIAEALDADNFDGVALRFHNDWDVHLLDSLSGFNTGDRSYLYTFSTTDVALPPDTLRGVKYPADYEIAFADGVIDTSAAMYGAPAVPVNFTVRNLTDNRKVTFIFIDNDNNGVLSAGTKTTPISDELHFFDRKQDGSLVYTWFMTFSSRTGHENEVYTFRNGDKIDLRTSKPFRKGDVYTMTPAPPTIDEAKAVSQLDRVKVVPNPYVAATTHELPLPPGVTSGRGERRVDFIHAPVDAVINIFTARGEHVVTLRAGGAGDNGVVSWNLKSKENLDVAFGVYFYVLESKAGTKSGKIAIIK